jgi:hypothetical protein
VSLLASANRRSVSGRRFRRREFILTNEAMSQPWSLEPCAPDLRIPVVGFASGGSRADSPPRCWIHVLRDPCAPRASATTPDLVSGAVVIWGRIEAHVIGPRASRLDRRASGYPTRLGDSDGADR